MAVGTLAVCECERVCDVCYCFLLLATNFETNLCSDSFYGLFLCCVFVFVFVFVFCVCVCACACICACVVCVYVCLCLTFLTFLLELSA